MDLHFLSMVNKALPCCSNCVDDCVDPLQNSRNYNGKSVVRNHLYPRNVNALKKVLLEELYFNS